MTTAHIDTEDMLEASEVDGAFTRVVRRVRVVDLEDTDYEVLQSALDAAGVPAAGDELGSTGLFLKERNPRLVNKGCVDVDLVYLPANSNGGVGQSFESGLVLGESSATLNQVESNLDGAGALITVEHTYPVDDLDFAGLTKVQGGTIQVFQPQITRRYRGIKATAVPWEIEMDIVGTVNENTWAGGDSRTWMCTACSWKPVDVGGSRFEFNVEFQYNPDTWDPTVVYKDERTGRPPDGLVAGTGYKTIAKYVDADFEAILGATLQGGS